jgi:hypothetical protein
VTVQLSVQEIVTFWSAFGHFLLQKLSGAGYGATVIAPAALR